MLIRKPGTMLLVAAVVFFSCFVFPSGEELELNIKKSNLLSTEPIRLDQEGTKKMDFPTCLGPSCASLKA